MLHSLIVWLLLVGVTLLCAAPPSVAVVADAFVLPQARRARDSPSSFVATRTELVSSSSSPRQRRLRLVPLWDTASSSSTEDSLASATSAVPSQNVTATTSWKDTAYDMPWSQVQEWALADHLAQYTVQIWTDPSPQLRVYTLWRTLAREVPALAGYPLSFLVERARAIRQQQNTTSAMGDPTTVDEILPYLDGYSFTAEGGVTGRVYGMAGVAEGTRLETTPVANLSSTLPQGYLLTQEGMLYELGLPASETTAVDRAAATTASMVAQEAASSLSSVTGNNVPGVADVMGDMELVKLSALTAAVIGGAWAMESLSHHLTVNVFWV